MEPNRAEQRKSKQQAASAVSQFSPKKAKIQLHCRTCHIVFLMCTKLSLFQIGDRIVSICGTSAEGMSHSQAVTLLKNATGTIQLQVSLNAHTHTHTHTFSHPFCSY